MPSVTLRVKYHNRTKVLLCYVLAWGLALLLPLLALVYLYPYKLAGSAPELGASLLALNVPLPQALRSALDSTGGGQAALGAAIAARDLVWRYVVGAAVALTWVLALLCQFLWRTGYMRPKSGARGARRYTHLSADAACDCGHLPCGRAGAVPCGGAVDQRAYRVGLSGLLWRVRAHSACGVGELPLCRAARAVGQEGVLQAVVGSGGLRCARGGLTIPHA